MGLVDLSYYERVSEGDKAFIAQMIRTFLEDVPVNLAKLQNAVEVYDLKMVARMAHKLKPAWSMSGLNVTLLTQMEESAQAAEPQKELAAQLAILQKIAAQAMDELLALLKNYE